MATTLDDTSPDPAALTAAVLEEEARRQDEQDERDADAVLLPDDLLPGVGDDAMPTREVLRSGGVATIGMLFLLNLFDEFDRAAMAVLAPNIQETLGVSDTTLGVLATLGGGLVVLAFIPIGFLADRMRRVRVISGVSAVLGVFMFATGLVREAWQLGVTRVGTGFGKGGQPAFNSVLADAYPIAGRARVFALFNLANPIGLLAGPAVAGAVAALAGGDEGWRWAFIILALPTLVLSMLVLFVREPQRGANEQQAIFGDDKPELTHEPPAMSAAWERLRKIKTFYYVLVGLGVMGFALFAFSIYFSLYLEEHYQLDALERGYVFSLAAIGGVIGAPVGGFVVDRFFRQSPPKAILAVSGLLSLFVFGVVAMYMPNVPTLIPMLAVAQLGVSAAISGLLAIIASVIPYRLRAMGYALAGVYIFFIGAFFGAVIAGQMSDAFGERTALTIMIPPALLVGGSVMAYGARFVRGDISLVVQELKEEQDEHERVKAGGEVPVLQVRNLDFSYGPIQVLFNVEVDVKKGEVLALLGTNGAGKSTLLRAVSGLAIPDRGVVRLNGRTVTYSDAETRVRAGIVQVPGGKAVFPTLSVRENLTVGAHTYVWDRERLDAKLDEVLTLFPRLQERLDQPAGKLSGGEQQMVALAKGLLLDPEILLIDELSLGLAPVVVQDILEVVETLKARGLTMVIVEQSVNIALEIADRAVFMEKGRVRFQGPAKELLERDDLVRAVFLGAEAGG
ncbi:MAG TPA: ATP-binding protein [Acidimicrobiales bacterium]|nr:ATP-binding protein [Acidimicrobiales bacterium]